MESRGIAPVTRSTKPRTFRHASFYGRIGVARADITPPVGIYARNWGAATHDLAQTIHRPLTLTAMTLAPATGDQILVLVETDLGGWKSLQTFREFFGRLSQELSIEPSNLIFALSHTHSAPVLMDADDSLPGAGLHRTWMEDLFESAVRTDCQGIDSSFLGTIEW